MMSRISAPVRKHPVTAIGRTLIRRLTPLEFTRNSAITILMCTTVCPFRYSRVYLCLYCSEKFLDTPHLVNHTSTAHGSLNEKDIRKILVRKARTEPLKVHVEEFGCKLCGNKMQDWDQLLNHLVEEHNKKMDVKNYGVIPYKIKGNDFECVHCNKQFVKYKLLNMHVKEHYWKHFCEQCGAGFVTTHGLKGHLITHDVGSFPCSTCSKVFKNQTSMEEHYKTVHIKTKRNICRVCNEAFYAYYNKLKHMIEVHGTKLPEYKCTYCPKVFILNSHWRAHEKGHLKLTEFSCDLCQYKHHSKNSLKRHMISHSDEKNHKCEVCKKSYARRRTLVEHMRIHNNDRRFACSFCDRAFVQKCSLKGHMRTHHKDVSVSV